MTDALKRFCKQELEAYRKFNDKRALAYKTWFYENSSTFTEVDEKLSKEIQERNDCKIKQCYHNTWISLSSNFNLRYFEGFEISKGIPIPIEHSWLMTANGKVVDPTLIINGKLLQNQMKEYGMTKEKISYKSRLADEYFGMEIPRQFVIDMGLKTKRTGSFLFDYFEQQNLPKIEENAK